MAMDSHAVSGGNKVNINACQQVGQMSQVLTDLLRAIFRHSSWAAENVAGAASSQLGHYLEPGWEQPKLVRIVRVCVDPVLLSVKYKRVKNSAKTHDAPPDIQFNSGINEGPSPRPTATLCLQISSSSLFVGELITWGHIYKRCVRTKYITYV